MPMSDDERLQLLKDYIIKYRYYLLVFVTVLLASIGGWRFYSRWQQRVEEQTLANYLVLLQHYERQKTAEAETIAQNIIKDYPRSVYAAFAGFLLAKDSVKAGKLVEARAYLERIVQQKAIDKALRQLARLRLARVLIQLKEHDAALKNLRVVDSNLYLAEIYEIRGDAYLKLGDKSEAEKNYRRAAELNKQEAVQSPLLKIKLQQF